MFILFLIHKSSAEWLNVVRIVTPQLLYEFFNITIVTHFSRYSQQVLSTCWVIKCYFEVVNDSLLSFTDAVSSLYTVGNHVKEALVPSSVLQVRSSLVLYPALVTVMNKLHFLNQFFFLPVGTWRGSTFISNGYRNQCLKILNISNDFS